MGVYVASWLLKALLWASACQGFMVLLGLYPFLQVGGLQHSWCTKESIALVTPGLSFVWSGCAARSGLRVATCTVSKKCAQTDFAAPLPWAWVPSRSHTWRHQQCCAGCAVSVGRCRCSLYLVHGLHDGSGILQCIVPKLVAAC